MTLALVDELRRLPAAERRSILERLSARQRAALRWCWADFWARPDVRAPGDTKGAGQLPPSGAWTWWASIGGRASGKTRACAQWICADAKKHGRGMIAHLVGQTIDDARAVMVEGTSGILACSPPWFRPDFTSSVEGGTLRWPNGARARLFGGDKPSKGRGPQCNRMWLDDPAAFGPKGKLVVDQLLWGFRLRMPDGTGPRGAISSTPIDTELLRWILSGERGSTSRIVYSSSTTDDNRANLAEEFFEQTIAEFAGTDEEQRERYGRMVAGAGVFDGVDFAKPPVRVSHVPELRTVAIAVDPTTTTGAEACEVGIVAGGIDERDHLFALEDLSGVLGADKWPDVVLDAVESLGAAYVVIEVNKGGVMGPELLRGAEKLRRAKAGKPALSTLEIRVVVARPGEKKARRAAPLKPLYVGGHVHHAPGLVALERQLRALRDSSTRDTDRADAWVYLARELAQIEDVGDDKHGSASTFEGMTETNAGIGAWEGAGSPAVVESDRDHGRGFL